MMMPLLKAALLWITAVSLVACTSIDLNRSGPAIDVFPVTKTLSLNTKDSLPENAQEHIKRFVEENKEAFLNRDIILMATNQSSKKLLQYTRSLLTDMGVDHLKVRVKPNLNTAARNFDFMIEITSYEVGTEPCQKAEVGDYYVSDYGCFSEGMRWKSMVAPERMLRNHDWHRE